MRTWFPIGYNVVFSRKNLRWERPRKFYLLKKFRNQKKVASKSWCDMCSMNVYRHLHNAIYQHYIYTIYRCKVEITLLHVVTNKISS